MELEQPKEDAAPTPPTPTPASQPKKPSQPLYVPKQRLPDRPQAQGEVKPRPRPRYTDKAKKNAKNKKDKAGAADKGAPVGGEDGGDSLNVDGMKPDVNEGQVEDTDVQVNGHPDSANVEAHAASLLEAASLQDDEAEEDSWDTLFNDDGDCLDPQQLEEVRSCCRSG